MTILELEQAYLLPNPVLKKRKLNPILEQQALAAGLDPIIARIIAGRPLQQALPTLDVLSPKLKHLVAPYGLKDIQLAAERVAKAIIQGECLGIETDHD